MPRKLESIADHWLHGSKPQNTLPGVSDIPAGCPPSPKRLSPGARKIFKQLCALLQERCVLTRGDAELLRLYCTLHDRQKHAQAKIDEQGEVCTYTRLDSNGQPHDMVKENIWLAIAERAEKSMLAILVQLGLTPAARARVRPLKPTKQEPKSFEEEYFSNLNRRNGRPITEEIQ
jgi:P27 family predicted phage terminase small subunit